MPITYSKRISELTSRLNVKPELKTFLDNAFTNLTPSLISEEDDDYQYYSLLLPVRQITNTSMPESYTVLHGIIYSAITNKKTGQLILLTRDLDSPLDEYIKQKNFGKHPIVGNKDKIGSARISFDRAILGDVAYNFRINMSGSSTYIERLEVKSILDKYHSMHPRPDNMILSHYFEIGDPTESPYTRHGFDVKDLFNETISRCTNELEIPSLLASTFKAQAETISNEFLNRVNTGVTLLCHNELKENIDHYTLDERNFILDGKGESKLYRQQFIDQCHQLVEEPRYNPDNSSTLNRGYDKNRASTYFYKTLIGKNEHSVASTFKGVDNGIFPLKQIGNAIGRSGLTKKQLKLAIKDWATLSKSMGNNSYSRSLGSLIQISSIPRNWLVTDAPSYGINELEKLIGANPVFSQSLKGCANQIDWHKSSTNKPALKNLAKEWSWLSQNTGASITDKLEVLRNKYNADSIYDYSKILNTFINAVQLRVFSEHPWEFRDCFVLDIESMEISSNSNLTFAASEVFENACRYELFNYEDDEEWYNPIENVSFSEDDSNDIHNNLVNSVSLLHLLKGSDALHKNISSIYTELSSYHTENINWTAFIDDTYTDGNITIEAISDRQTLGLEGTAMSHCVSSYLNACLIGDSYILSVKEQGERVGTLELTAEEYLDSDEEEKLEVRVAQLMAKGNTTVSSNIENAVHKFVDKIEAGDIRANHDVTAENEDLIYQCETGGVEEYGHLKTIPYHTDAAYLAMHYLETHLNKYQKNMCIDSIFESAGGNFAELYYISDFKKEYNLIKTLSASLNVSPDLLIQTKNTNNLLSFDKAADVLTKNTKVADVIIHTANSMDCEGAENVSKAISNTLKNQFDISIPVDVIQEMDLNKPLTQLTTFINQQTTFVDVVEDNYVFRDKPQSKMDAQFAMARR